MKPSRILYTARAISMGGRSGHTQIDDGLVSHTVAAPKEIGSPGALPHSLNAAMPEAAIAVIGVMTRGGVINPIPLLPTGRRVQRRLVGHRTGFQAMNAAITFHNIPAAIDQRIEVPDPTRGSARRYNRRSLGTPE